MFLCSVAWLSEYWWKLRQCKKCLYSEFLWFISSSTRTNTEVYTEISTFSLNTGKHRPEELEIRTLIWHLFMHSFWKKDNIREKTYNFATLVFGDLTLIFFNKLLYIHNACPISSIIITAIRLGRERTQLKY